MSLAESKSSALQVHFQAGPTDTRVILRGELRGGIPDEQAYHLLSAVQPGRSITIDMTELRDVSSTGLRSLLLYCRYVAAVGSTLTNVGFPEKLLDIAEAAGFVQLFRSAAAWGGKSTPLRSQRLAINAYPTHEFGGYALRAGHPLPLGATVLARGVNFSIFSRHATACSLVLFEQGTPEILAEIPIPDEFRLGDIFSMIVFDLVPERLEYGYRLDGPWAPELGHRFDRSQLLLDPTARSVAGRERWRSGCQVQGVAPYRARLIDEDFDWEGDRSPHLPWSDLVIYEAHVRGFTQSPSSGVKFPGTFAGLRAKIPYLKSLGVNAIELMPVFEFDELENPRSNPFTGERLVNYWGYSTVGFYAPNSSYAASSSVGMQADEFKSLVKELHRAGIEVILDVVFNHTAEGDENGPTISFRGIDNRTYYLLTPDGNYFNFSGCGNTLNCNHPVVRDLVVDCLRYWVSEYHIDGFRFDLASILGRDQRGVPLANPPLLESLAADPVLGRTKLIAEAWDAAGLYQVGRFPAYARWSEWNGQYRDVMRRFLRGDFGISSEVAARLLGSQDLYDGRGPSSSINFITAHDGFTLADLFAYNEKHNESNGEANQDGSNENFSWNCGVEGPTDDPAIVSLRLRQAKNAFALLLLSQGVPMFTMGDECGRTQQGNNNAYCHDSPLNWFDWTQIESQQELWTFAQRMIDFRRHHPAVRHAHYVGEGPRTSPVLDVIWHGTRAWTPDWSPGNRVLAFSLKLSDASGVIDELYVAINMHSEALTFEVPRLGPGRRWHLSINTALAPPHDIAAIGQELPYVSHIPMECAGRSIVVLVAESRSVT